MPFVAFLFIFIAAIAAWGVLRLRRGRAAIRAELERAGYEVVRMERRMLRQGPFQWTTSRSQIVYRALARQPGGPQRAVWARWGRTWLPKPDTIELEWEE